jgi:transcriptional regulator with XRE-family HTH domain
MLPIRKQQCCLGNKKVNTEITFSQRLKTWRKAAGLSQESAAEKLGVSRSYLNQVEKGSRTAGRKLVTKFHEIVNTENLAMAGQAVRSHDWDKAFRHFIQGTDPASLIERLSALLSDESVAVAERLQLANMVLPVLHARVSQLQRDFDEAEATLAQSSHRRRA